MFNAAQRRIFEISRLINQSKYSILPSLFSTTHCYVRSTRIDMQSTQSALRVITSHTERRSLHSYFTFIHPSTYIYQYIYTLSQWKEMIDRHPSIFSKNEQWTKLLDKLLCILCICQERNFICRFWPMNHDHLFLIEMYCRI